MKQWKLASRALRTWEDPHKQAQIPNPAWEGSCEEWGGWTCVFIFIKEAEFSSPCLPWFPVVMQGLEPLGYHRSLPFSFYPDGFLIS